MLKDKLQRMFRGGSVAASPAASDRQTAPARQGLPEHDRAYLRRSLGLEQFFARLAEEEGLWLLDLGGASQENVGFITNLGHRLYSCDFLRTLDAEFPAAGEDGVAPQADPRLIARFLAQHLDFERESFDGVLLWDALEYLVPPLLKATVERLFEVVKPGAYMLGFFHADERAALVPSYSYRIADAGTLLLAPRGMRQPAQLFNNRSIEKLFQRFHSVKFFLARDHLREVIVRR